MYIYTDKGTEFDNRVVKKYLEDNNATLHFLGGKFRDNAFEIK